jgi:hypothetical protein
MLNDIELGGSVWWNDKRKRNRVVSNGNVTMDKIVKNALNINRLEPMTLDNVTLALSTAAHKPPVTVLARGWRPKFVYINPQKLHACTCVPNTCYGHCASLFHTYISLYKGNFGHSALDLHSIWINKVGFHKFYDVT